MRCNPIFLLLALSAPASVASLSQLPTAEGAVLWRGGATAGLPPKGTLPGCGVDGEGDGSRDNQPPIGEVVGAGAVGVLAGQVLFQSLVISAGLGVASMSVAASSADGPGEIARSSGRMAVAVFDRVTQLNNRYQLTDRLVDGARMAGWRLRKFDQEHAVVHRATEGTKKAWLDVQEFNEAHEVTTKAGETISSSLDKLTEVLTPPPSSKAAGESSCSSGRGSSSSGRDICQEEPYRDIGGSRAKNSSRKSSKKSKSVRSSSSKKRGGGERRRGQRKRREGIRRGARKDRRDWTVSGRLLPALDRDEAERWLAEFRENGRRWIVDHEQEVLDT